MSQVVTIKGQDIHGNTKVASLDFITNALQCISTDHAYIHNEYMYSSLIGPVSLAAGTTRKVTFLTPTVASGKYIHWRPSLITCSADKLTATISGASATDVYTVYGEIKSELSTIPTSTLTYSMNTKAVIEGVVGASQRNADDIAAFRDLQNIINLEFDVRITAVEP